MPKKKLTKEQRQAFRDARVTNYQLHLSPQTLASMVVELEDESNCPPEFEYDEEWPSSVQHLKPKAGS